MQCTSPMLLSFKGKYKFLYREGLTVPCGKCLSCRIARAREWSLRLLHELESWDNAVFVCYTYNDDNLPADLSVKKSELQLYFKRLRKELKHRKIKYYACGEYGEKKGRPHYHAIIFGISPAEKELLQSMWYVGNIDVGTVTYDSCRYVAQYLDQKLSGKSDIDLQGRETPFQLCSTGIGKKYCEDNKDVLKRDLYTSVRGVMCGLPRYYKKKLGIDSNDYKNIILQQKTNELYKWYKKGIIDDVTIDYLKSKVRKSNEVRIRTRTEINHARNRKF